MTSTLTTLTVVWALVTTVVVVLGYWRARLGLHDVLGVHLSSGAAVDADEAARGQKIERLDRFGIPLTVVSILLAFAMLLVWAVDSAGMPGM